VALQIASAEAQNLIVNGRLRVSCRANNHGDIFLVLPGAVLTTYSTAWRPRAGQLARGRWCALKAWAGATSVQNQGLWWKCSESRALPQEVRNRPRASIYVWVGSDSWSGATGGSLAQRVEMPQNGCIKLVGYCPAAAPPIVFLFWQISRLVKLEIHEMTPLDLQEIQANPNPPQMDPDMLHGAASVNGVFTLDTKTAAGMKRRYG